MANLNQEDDDQLFEVVISGIGGAFPESDNIDEFKQNLFDKKNLVTVNGCRWNPDRWKNTPSATGKIQNTQHLDATFFGLLRPFANGVDPIIRASLEKAFEAIVDAGVNPYSLSGGDTSVYSCSNASENDMCTVLLFQPSTGYPWLLSHAHTFLSNRLSNILDFHGTSVSTFSYWLGGMEVLKLAVDDIRRGRTKNALVLVSNVILYPEIMRLYSKLGVLSQSGVTKAFDDEASGYGRSDAVVAFFLQREGDALKEYAKVVHVDVCQGNGIPRKIASVHPESFQHFLNKFYSDCNVSPSDVSFLEAYGCGVHEIDEVELNVISEVFCQSRQNPLNIGSVKSNAGHAEAVSSLISLAKALICADTGFIPPNINYDKPNSKVPGLIDGRLKVVTEKTVLEGMHVAVNGFNLSGGMGHVLLEKRQRKELPTHYDFPRLILFSARHEAGVSEVMSKIESGPMSSDYHDLIQKLFAVKFSGHFFRGFTILPTSSAYHSHGSLEQISDKRSVWFICTGMGCQWTSMASELMDFPVFAKSLHESASILKPFGIDLIKVITKNDKEILENIVHSFVGITSIQVALVDLLLALGIKPDGMIGHSLGEACCAYIDGCFTRQQTIMCAYFRGKSSVDVSVEEGCMVAVGANYKEFVDLPPTIIVGCRNSSTSCTLSGLAKDVEKYCLKLKERNIFHKIVDTGKRAYHSQYIAGVGKEFRRCFEPYVPSPKKRSQRWISSSIPEERWSTELAQYSSAAYQHNNFVSTVLFDTACSHIPENAVVIEIAPHGLLQSILTKALPANCIHIPLMKRSAGNQVKFLLSAVGKLFNAGLDVNLDPLYPATNFPISSSTPSLAPLMTWNHSDEWNILPSVRTDARVFNVTLGCSEYKFLLNHQMGNKIILPTSFILLKLLEEYCKIHCIDPNSSVFLFENTIIHEDLIINVNDDVVIEIELNEVNGNFELVAQSAVLLTGVLTYENAVEKSDDSDKSWYDNNISRFSSSSSHHEADMCIEKTDIYSLLDNAGIHLTSPFNSIERLLLNNKECLFSVRWTNDKVAFLDAILKIQVVLGVLNSPNCTPLLPCRFQRLMINFADFLNFSEGSCLPVIVDSASHCIEAEGVSLRRMETSPLKIMETLEINAESIQFIPHINPPVPALEQFLDLCLQLISDAISPDWMIETTPIYVLKWKKTNGASDQILQMLISNYRPNYCVDFQIIDDLDNFLSLVSKNCVVLDNGLILNSIFEKFSTGFLLLTLSEKDPFFLRKDTALLTETVIDGKRYMLLRKVTESKPLKILKTHNNSLDIKLINKSLVNIDGELIVVWEKLSNVDPLKILHEAREQELFKQNVRFVFILDSNEEPFSPKSPFYQERLKCGLVVNILKKSLWGGLNYAHVIMHQDNQSRNSNSVSFNAASKRYFSNWKYIGVNLKDLTIDQNSEREADFRFIDYVGHDSDNNRIMGLAYFNENDSCLEYDPILKWVIPGNWSDEDLSTIPYLYSLAYYMLAEVPRLTIKDRTILIFGGNSAVGRAAICVALELGAIVLTTVDSLQETSILVETFPQLNESHLLLLDNTLEYKVRHLIKGQELFVVINPYSGSSLQKSLNLKSDYGICIQIGSIEMNKRSKIGMNVFLRGGSLIGLSDLDFSMCPSKTKRKIHHFISEKLKCSSLKPLPRTIFNWNEQSSALEYVTRKNQGCKAVISMQNYRKEESILWDMATTYLIIASEQSMWIQFVQWLLKRSVEHIVLALSGNTINKAYKYQLHELMKKYNKVSFSLLRDVDVETIQGTQNLFNTVCNQRSPFVIFCLSLDKSKLRNVDSVSRKNVHSVQSFICLFSDAEEMCHDRTTSGFPSISVESKSLSAEHFRFILPYLENILDHLSVKKNTAWSSSIFMNKYRSQRKASDNFNLLLPTSLHDLVELSYELTESPKFVEAATQSYHFKDTQECDPIFFIPAYSIKSLKGIFKGLMYPAFCATPSFYTESAEATAFDLFQSLKEIKPNGFYTIVAETWSSCIALELGLLLENDGNTVKLILINGSPESIKQNLVDFNLKLQRLNNYQSLSTQLLRREKVDVNALVKQIIANSSTVLSSKEEERIKSSLLSVRSKLIAAQAYKTKFHAFKGEVLILKQQQSDSEICLELLQNLNENQFVCFTTDTSHENLVNRSEIVSFINENHFITFY